MDPSLVYAKTPTGDEAVRQSTRVVQRNLRMVLVQVDGKMSIADLAAKIGNPRLVEAALRELEEGGFIAPTVDAVSVWEESKKAGKIEPKLADVSAMSQFSTFGPKSLGASSTLGGQSVTRNFSSFGKPVLPTSPAVADSPKNDFHTATDSERGDDFRPYKPGMSTRRRAVLGLMAFLGIFSGVVTFYPYERFKPSLEGAATRWLNMPVKIDRIGVALFPSPRLKLNGLHLGESADGLIAEASIASPLSLLGSGPYQIPRIDVSGVDLPANLLVSLPFFAATKAQDTSVVFRKIVVTQSSVSLGEGLSFSDLYGELTFRADGALEKTSFETVDRSLLIEATPADGGVALSIEGRAWKPADTPVSFPALQAKGLLRGDRLLVQNIDTTFLGGILRGSWLLDWSKGLSMTGDGTLSRLDSRKLSAAFAPLLKIEGDMSGTIRLRSAGSDWNGLWANAEATLNTEITRGILHGVDLGEAVRRGGVSDVRAGSTKFDRLRSTVNITPKQVVARDVRLDAGMMTAAGQFVSGRDGQVEGSMAVTLQSSVLSQQASIRIFGTLPDLTAATRK